MQWQTLPKVLRCGWLVLVAFALSSMAVAQQYQQTNLDSDIVGLAINPQGADGVLCNPWGIATAPGSPVWVANNNSGTSTLYDVNGNLLGGPLVVEIPPTTALKANCADNSTGATGTPTGVVFTGGSGFVIPGTNPPKSAIFTFVTEDGTISAWGGGKSAVPILDNSKVGLGAVYKGATLALNGKQPLLYVTNFREGTIETYDSNFSPVHLDADGDGDDDSDEAFRDHAIPRGFAPFNVQAVTDSSNTTSLYVTYAKQNAAKHDDFDAPGLGFVDKFSPAGKLLQRLKPGAWLDAPWGVALAPASFGFFGNHLLIGNVGSGQIAVYDPGTGRFDGLLRDQNGHALQNQRLWALHFSDGISRNGNPPTQGPPNTLFFTAGINDEADGLFGTITPADNATPENDRDDH